MGLPLMRILRGGKILISRVSTAIGNNQISRNRSALKSRIDLYVIARVRERRLALGLSQAELASAIGVSPNFISKVESQ